MPDEVRPFPLTSMREAVEKQLSTLPAHTALVSLDTDGATVNTAVMVHTGKDWSFAGWLSHHVPTKKTAAGFEIRKSW